MANYYQKLTEYYRDLRFRAQAKAAENNARARKDERWRKIDNRLSDIERELAFAELNGEEEKRLALEAEKKELSAEAESVLRSLGLTRRELAPVYACEKCGDTGFIGSAPCACYKKALKNIAVGDIGIDLNGAAEIDENELTDENKRKAYRLMQRFADKFPDSKRKNFVFLGTTGTGKTMIALSAAARVAKRGYNVLFLTSFELNNVFLEYHSLFSAERNVLMDSLVKADLLVIDDLGAEQNFRNVTNHYLVSLLGERNLKNLSTIVTTNLTSDEILARYDERIFSRLFDKRQSAVIHFVGKDMRLEN